MGAWARRRQDPVGIWHRVPREPAESGIYRAGCGLSMGTDPKRIEWQRGAAPAGAAICHMCVAAHSL